jgi:hypothetical protein
VACLHATHYLSNGIKEYSQWFCGTEYNVANALSRDNGITDDELTQILPPHCSSQLPQPFDIVLLLTEIVSLLTLLLQRLLIEQQLVEMHLTAKLGRGIVTPSTATALDSATFLSSKERPKHIKSKSLEVMPWLFVKDNFLDHVMLPWMEA